MTIATQAPRHRRPKRLSEASLLEAPPLLLRRIRGMSNSRTLSWIACVPLALFGLGAVSYTHLTLPTIYSV